MGSSFDPTRLVIRLSLSDLTILLRLHTEALQTSSLLMSTPQLTLAGCVLKRDGHLCELEKLIAVMI